MGVSSFAGLGFSPTKKPNKTSISECEVSALTSGDRTLEHDPDSDGFWVAMMKQEGQDAAQQESIWRPFYSVDTTDQRRNEIEEADRKGILDLLKKSYARRADTIVWSMIVFILAAVVLIPLLGFVIGPTFAALVGVCWAAVHRIRRL